MYATNCLRQLLSNAWSTRKNSYPQGFSLFKEFLSLKEQQVLLTSSLRKLDDTESRRARRRRKLHSAKTTANLTSLEGIFLPDEFYEFQEGHYDGVIHHYREIHLSSWPEDEIEGLSPILERIYALCPTKDVQTHLLHLASYGRILPHIDNVSASGSWIMGISLGDERALRMESVDSSFDVMLPSGSLYLQRDEVRYKFKHSIVADTSRHRTQRLSIMIRDRLPLGNRSTGQ
ncbi:hypothetical protein BDQ12DRAFT_676696 [Crucibulum laeve]|uniref:Alpha-ketoglutarate-dependent dioxygenase AlkB-like domain-containing protein n=1 Tax=Crucibulum laeve TaxID=68775 RepID=A0A5C3MBZ9_9AGAR|nr:hypothetical protein BDQ12DRAFT_676696 [Crucibulum laeve]